MSNYPKKVFLNGEILEQQDAKISVFDRGFIFGDGIYEVMVKVDGDFFYERLHLERLSNCLDRINIDFDVNSLSKSIEILLQASELENKDCLLYMQITRGVAPRGHAFPKGTKPTVMMYALPFVLPDINEKHLITVSMPDHRWHRCDIKMTSLLGNIMAYDHAMKKGAYESILVRDGSVITEASHCNVFFVKDNIVYTHPANEQILDGITRQIVIRLCNKLNIEIKEVAVDSKDVIYMDEAFLTGTTTQIASVKQIDEHLFYQDDSCGSVTRKLQEAFLALKRQKLWSQKI